MASLLQTAWFALPRGHQLPEGVWPRRHRAIVALLALHAAGLAGVAFGLGYGGWHALLEGGSVATAAVVAAIPALGRRVRASIAALGLMSASAVLVHLSGGYIEMHFHFFVMVGVLALYQDWMPFLLAVAYVVLHHGVVGVLLPSDVYNHPAALAAPWLWAGIHGGFLLAASVVSVVAWRVSETAHARLNMILRSAGEGICGLDGEGRITFINQAARRVYDLLTARNKQIKFETADERRARIARADTDYPEAAATLSQMLLGPVVFGLKVSNA